MALVIQDGDEGRPSGEKKENVPAAEKGSR